MSILEKYYRPFLILILAFAFFSRIIRLQLPETYVFDEVYHALTAKLIARNDNRAYEWWNPAVEPNTSVDWLHPPLAKYTQAASMLIFGENSFGWRFSSAIFGVGVIWATAYLSLLLFKNKPLSLLAAFLAALDGLLLVQSRIAMNDIHVTFFILLTLIFYRRFQQSNSNLQINKWIWLTGLSAGLAIGTKWSGLFILGFVWLWESLRIFLQHDSFRSKFSSFSRRLVVLGLLPVVIYILAYSHMFLQGKTLICLDNHPIQGQCYAQQITFLGKQHQFFGSHFYELHRQIWWYQTHLEATHQYQSRPWQWFLDLRPVWMYVQYKDADHIANIYSFGNPFLFWIGDIGLIASLGLMTTTLVQLIRAWKKQHSLSPSLRRKLKNSLTIGFVLLSYCLVWMPWQLSPRIMFFYHYTPAVPLLSINLAYWLHRIWTDKTKTLHHLNVLLVITTIVIIIATFFVFYPDWTGIVVPKWIVNNVYFAIKSWH